LEINNDTEHVFVYSKTKKPYTKNINRDLWNPACKKAGIHIKLINAFRHSFACNMLNSGVNQSMVSRLLGHQSPTMINKYGVYDTEALNQVVTHVQDNK